MRRPPLRSVFLLGVLAGLVLALVRVFGRDGRPGPAPLAAPPAPLPATTAPTVAPVPVALATVDPEPTPEPAPAPASVVEPAAEPEVVAPGAGEVPTWVAAVEGACPDGYPIKAKEASGIYHQPGGLSYDRTRPDRCYADAAAAEADGFRAAKR